MVKVDLHTHSTASHDGGIKAEEYGDIIERGVLDYIAITDHNTIDLAMELHGLLGSHIIVGEEIMTTQGELIGLYLTDHIKPGMSAIATARAITAQGGLVYVPHPFETIRSGITRETLDVLANEVDIVEVHNGRALFQNRGPLANTWSRLANKPIAASSDAHGKKGIGTSFTVIDKPPTVKTLVRQLASAHFVVGRPPFSSLLYPKYHRLRKRIGLKK